MDELQAAVPYATQLITGKPNRVAAGQNTLLLSQGDWLLKIHSVTFVNVQTPVEALVELRCNLVRPNQTLQRAAHAGRGDGEETLASPPHADEQVTPLKIFPLQALKTDKTEVVKPIVHVPFADDGPLYRVNSIRPLIEFQCKLVAGNWWANGVAPPNVKIHFSYYRFPTVETLSERHMPGRGGGGSAGCYYY